MSDESKPAFKLPQETQESIDAAMDEAIRLLAPEMDFDAMLRKLVYVAGDKEFVAFLDRPWIHRSPHIVKKLLSRNTTSEPTGKFNRDGTPEMKDVPAFDKWMAHPRRKNVYGLRFDPNKGDTFKENGDGYLNLWRPILHEAPSDWQECVKPFLEHATYLAPVESERNLLLDWLAHIQQKPGELPHHGFLMTTPVQGTGRNAFANILSRVWEGHVALDFNLGEALKSDFNGQLSRKLMAVCDEINEGGGVSEAWNHAEKLKSIITTRERWINIKHGAQYPERNCCRFLAFSNSLTALPLGYGDRRWNVIHNPVKPKSEGYYKTLYALIDDDLFIASVREYLIRRDLTNYNPGEHAVLNSAKKQMLSASLSERDERAREIVSSRTHTDLIEAKELKSIIYEIPVFEGYIHTPDPAITRAFAKIASSAGMMKYPNPVYLNRVRIYPWILRNHELWLDATPEQVAYEIYRCRSEGGRA